jgi:hypothetical protein
MRLNFIGRTIPGTYMKRIVGVHLLLLIVMTLLTTGIAWSQGGTAAKSVPTSDVDPCKHDVLQYQSNIELVRKSLGDKAANELAAKFMSKTEWDAMLLSDGYCGIAWQLHMKKLK